jgi:ferredoxin
VAATHERVVGDLRLGIDATLCVGFGDCVTAAPGAFRLDAEGIVEFADPAGTPREQLLAACAACPVDALLVWDAHGAQVIPAVHPLPLTPDNPHPLAPSP